MLGSRYCHYTDSIASLLPLYYYNTITQTIILL